MGNFALPVFGFPCSSAGKESASKAGDLGLIPGLGRSPGEEKGYPLQYLAWRIPWTVHEVTESDTTEQLSLSTSSFSFSDLVGDSECCNLYKCIYFSI